jgi:thioredoxin reductase
MAELDLVVVGGGSAGLIGARTAARLGATVALVEAERTGGECLYTGCVPSKALIAAARDGDGFDAAIARVRAAIAAIEPQDSPERLEASGVRVLSGRAFLDSDGGVRVDGRRVPSRAVLLATGAAPALPALEGLDPAGAFTSESVWSLAGLPEWLAVVGGGPAGCELGQAFARLGSEVTLVGCGPRGSCPTRTQRPRPSCGPPWRPMVCECSLGTRPSPSRTLAREGYCGPNTVRRFRSRTSSARPGSRRAPVTWAWPRRESAWTGEAEW